MRIYKVRVFVNRYNRKNNWITVLDNEQIVLNNLETAKNIYKSFLNEFECEISYNSDNKKGQCQLFEPVIHKGGSLAYYPERDNYIELKTHNI